MAAFDLHLCVRASDRSGGARTRRRAAPLGRLPPRRADGRRCQRRTSLSEDGSATPFACAAPLRTFWLCVSIAELMQACPAG